MMPDILGTRTLVREISAHQARRMMAERTDYVLLDVRTEEEHKERRIKGAVLIPHDEIRMRAKDLPKDKRKTIMVYCRRGIRSEKASKELTDLGYRNVYDMGGVESWPYETVAD